MLNKCFPVALGDEEVDGEHHQDRRDPDAVVRLWAGPSPEVQVDPVPARARARQLPQPGVPRGFQDEQEGGEAVSPESQQSSC